MSGGLTLLVALCIFFFQFNKRSIYQVVCELLYNALLIEFLRPVLEIYTLFFTNKETIAHLASNHIAYNGQNQD